MVLTPGIAAKGSKTPLMASVMPGPTHVPPGVAATSVTAGSFEQNGPTAVMVASGGLPTVIDVVLESEHPPVVIAYVIVNVPTPADAGVKVPATASVIPVPLQVPPGVAAVRLNGASVVQKGPAGVIVASGAGLTTIEILFVSEQEPVVSV